MKLSQKLLGLAGVALADYACCPYDDYGLPDAACTGVLREKTPFAGSGFQQNDCKAWEFNADAIFEGNNLCGDNYGQCGFQRQFRWGTAGPTVAPAENTLEGQFSITADFAMRFAPGATPAQTAAWDPVLGASDFDVTYTQTTTDAVRANSNGWGIGRAPKLGAVCKLFVPVPPKHVVQVQVAGVHKAGGSTTMFPGNFKANSAQASPLDGTVFCFSVVNPSEGDVNSNGVANGNVNGVGSTGALLVGDDFAASNSLARQDGLNPARNFGDYLIETATESVDASNDGNNSRGGNFDVVAHFSTAWCTQGFPGTVVEMQQTGDYNNGDADYQIAAGTNAHAHNDIVEKRFAASEYGTYTLSGGYMTNSVTSPADTNQYRWPNRGAWAGYHSVISCAQYDNGNGNGHWVFGANARDYVMSVSAPDYRQGSNTGCTGLNYRFNVRQVGTAVENCGPAQLPDADNKRCTWNWNYENSPTEPESFFDRTDNQVFNTWSGRKRRNAVSHDAADPNTSNPAVLTATEFTFAFVDGEGNSVTPTALTPDASKYFPNTVTASPTPTAHLECLTTVGPFRDNFPDCFFGDEVHFSVTYNANDQQDARARISSWFSTVGVVHQ